MSGRKIENRFRFTPTFSRVFQTAAVTCGDCETLNAVTLYVNSLGLKVRTSYVCEVFVPH